MKSLRQDPVEKAYMRGYLHGLQGKSGDLCPFCESSPRQAWMKGWHEGREDQLSHSLSKEQDADAALLIGEF